MHVRDFAMRLLLLVVVLGSGSSLAATTVEALLADATRLGGTRATGFTDQALTRHLKELSAKAGVTLPSSPQ